MIRDIHRMENGRVIEVKDTLALEEPLEIRLGFETAPGIRTHKAISITMRTPGNDEALAAGFLFTEGIIANAKQVEEIRHCGPLQNTLKVELRPEVQINFKRLERNFYTSSSCGVCGKSSLEALRIERPFSTDTLPAQALPFGISSRVLCDLPARLRQVQENFELTGGLHASALFSEAGDLLAVHEDVGRHNALDKVIGAMFLKGDLPLSQTILLVSGRASFELLQKASMARIPIVAAIGAPSSLAVECAVEFGITLVGFLRGERFNIYSGSERILHDPRSKN